MFFSCNVASALCVSSLPTLLRLIAQVCLSTEHRKTSWEITAIRPLAVSSFDIYFWWSAPYMYFVWSAHSLLAAVFSWKLNHCLPPFFFFVNPQENSNGIFVPVYPLSALFLMNISAAADRRAFLGALLFACPHHWSPSSEERTSFN